MVQCSSYRIEDSAVEQTCVLARSDLDTQLTHGFISATRIAWDIETSGLDPHRDRIGTVQIHAPEVGSVVVQLNKEVPTSLCKLLEDDGVLKVFHHAMFDLRFMVAHWKVRPARIACTKVASKLLTPQLSSTDHTLQSLLAEYLGVTINKDERLANWLAPSLTDSQLAYACGDVLHLLPLLDQLEQRLCCAGLSEIYQSCLDFLPTRVTLDLGRWPDVFAY